MKKIIALLLALVLVLGLAACSVETAPAATEAPKTDAPAADAAPAAPTYTAPAAPAAPAAPTGFSGQVMNMHSGKQEVVLYHAKAFDDAAKAADELRRKKAVILNMENVDKALTRRVVDFLSGSGRQREEGRTVHLSVLPPQHGCCW